MMCDLEPAEIRKGKEFVVEIARPGPAGQAAAARLGLPASWGELEDALAKARVTDNRVIYGGRPGGPDGALVGPYAGERHSVWLYAILRPGLSV